MKKENLKNFSFSGDYPEIEAKLKVLGLKGFKTIGNLKYDSSSVPETQGIYIVLRKSEDAPKFVIEGTGGFFKGKNPNVSISELEAHWMENTPIMYIGKAGANRLRKRIKEYMKFGSGKSVGHSGGRYIWQLADADELIVCWCPTEEDSREVEKYLIQIFKKEFGARPFANLAD